MVNAEALEVKVRREAAAPIVNFIVAMDE